MSTDLSRLLHSGVQSKKKWAIKIKLWFWIINWSSECHANYISTALNILQWCGCQCGCMGATGLYHLSTARWRPLWSEHCLSLAWSQPQRCPLWADMASAHYSRDIKHSDQTLITAKMTIFILEWTNSLSFIIPPFTQSMLIRCHWQNHTDRGEVSYTRWVRWVHKAPGGFWERGQSALDSSR